MRISTFYSILILLITGFGESPVLAHAASSFSRNSFFATELDCNHPDATASHEQTVSESKLEAVTVYRRGALIKRTGEVTLAEGENILSIVGLEIGIAPSTIQIAIADDASVFSIAYSTDPNRKVIEPDSLVDLRKLRQEIELEKRMLGADIEALHEELAILNANKNFSRRTSEPEEIQRGAKLISESVRATKHALVKLSFEFEELDKKATQVDNRIATVRPTVPQNIGKIYVTSIANRPGTYTYELSYLVQDAGWTPDYDLFSKTVENQFAELVLVGNIYQRTGIDWKDVELSLSTGNPQQRKMAPSLRRLYLGENNAYNQLGANGMMLTAEQVKLLGANSINAIASLSAGASAEDFGEAISMKGGRSNATQYIIDGMRVTGTLVVESDNNDDFFNQNPLGSPNSYLGTSTEPVPQISFASEKSMLTSRTYTVDYPVSLAANGTSSAVRLTSHILPLDLRYRSVPKIDPTVYLEGIVTGWDTLRLSDGRMRLHLDGRYLGTTVLIANQPSDTLLLPLGADKRIIIERESAKQLVDRKPVRGRKNYDLGYIIKVRNTRQEAIKLVIEDQMPLSKKQETEVELISAGLSPKHDTQTGIFTWDLSLAAASAEEIEVAYKVTAGKFVKVNFE